MRALLAVCLLACVGAASEPAAWETKCELAVVGGKQKTITLHADGRLANAKGETNNCRWRWSPEGLWLKWYSGRVLLTPVPDEPGVLRGRRMNVKPGTEAPEQEMRVLEPDGAGVLAWAEPILDGRTASAIEKQADAVARAIVADQMSRQWAGVQAAARKLDGAQAALDKEAHKASGTAAKAQRDQASVQRASGQTAKYKRQTYRRTDPNYSWGSFSRALSKWKGWEAKRNAAQYNLEHNQAALERIRDRGHRLAADVRQAQAEYEVKEADYWIECWSRWRPIYQQRKAAFKAEAVRLAAEAEARLAEKPAE